MFRLAAILLSLLLALGSGPFAAAQEEVLVVGHRNPDTDCVVGALAVAGLKTRRGTPASAAIQGPVPPETQFVLETFHLAAPSMITRVAGRKVILVDHADLLQAPADLAQAVLVGLVDHHAQGGLGSRAPYEAWVQPVGSVCTVVARMYAIAGEPVPAPLAGAMLCAILSDTVMFKSPATTREDREAAAALARTAGVGDVQALGLRMFEAGSQVDGVPAADLLKRGLKTYDLGGRKFAVGQLEMVDTGRLAPRLDELMAAMARLKDTGFHSVLLMLTDLQKEGTELLLLSDEPGRVAAALGAAPKAGRAWLPGVLSRKRQLIPALEKAFGQ